MNLSTILEDKFLRNSLLVAKEAVSREGTKISAGLSLNSIYL
jgi:hypothetical protein